jgi:hypothetical protein
VIVIDNYPVVKLLLEILLTVPVDYDIFKFYPVYVELSGQLESVYVDIQLLGSDIIAYCCNNGYPEFELLNIYCCLYMLLKLTLQ